MIRPSSSGVALGLAIVGRSEIALGAGIGPLTGAGVALADYRHRYLPILVPKEISTLPRQGGDPKKNTLKKPREPFR